MTEIESKFKLPARYGTPGSNIWLDMIELGVKYKPVDLGLGFPGFAPPKHVTEALAEVAVTDNYSLHQYTKGFGHPRLVNILGKLYSKLLNRQIDPNTEILITEGGQQALYNAFNGLLDEGDEVIVIEPFFEPYESMINETGATVKFIPLRQKISETDNAVLSTNDFSLDKTELENMFNSKTKVILVNTPNNPIGKVFNMEEMQMIANLCKKWNVVCIADEVYEWLVYEANHHVRMATLPGMWERTITIGSAGKSFSITGWRTGWSYGPANLIENLQIVHQNCIYTHLTPIQEAIAMAYEIEYKLLQNNPKESYFNKLTKELVSKRDLLVEAFIANGFKPIKPQGGYMLMVDIGCLEAKMDMSKETNKYKDVKMSKWLAKNGLLGIPGSVFYSEPNKKLAQNFVRLCFIKNDDVLKEAVKVLQNIK